MSTTDLGRPKRRLDRKKFALAVANGLTLHEAAIIAGAFPTFAAAQKAGTRLTKEPRVQGYVALYRERNEARTERAWSDALRRAEEVLSRPILPGDAVTVRDRLEAAQLVGRVKGVFIERHQLDVGGNVVVSFRGYNAPAGQVIDASATPSLESPPTLPALPGDDSGHHGWVPPEVE